MIKKQFILGVIFFAFFFLDFLFTVEPKEVIKITKLTGNIYKLDHNPTYNFVHLASIGEDGILLIDTASQETGKELLAKLKKLGNGNIRYIVNTHIHGDHIGANKLLAAEAPIIAHSKARERFFQQYYHLPPIEPGGVPVITFEDKLTLYFNNEKIILKHVRSGHTDGDVIVYFPGSKIVYIGDLIIHNRFSTVDISRGGDIEGFIKNLEYLISDYPDDTRFFPAHGPEYSKDNLRSYHEAFASTAPLIENQLKEGKSIDEIIDGNIFKNYKTWERKKDWVEVINVKRHGKGLPSICEPITKTLVKKGIIEAINQYHFLKKKSPDKYNFEENQLNTLGYQLLQRNMIKESIEIFNLNVDAYPKSANVYDSLGEAYMKNGENEKAIRNYKKSLELDPSNKNAEEKLKELHGENE